MPGMKDTRGASILLADDDSSALRPLAIFLRMSGFQVTTAVDGEDALRAIARGSFDLLVLDILMPGATGWEVLEHAMAATLPGKPMPRALLITGFHEEYSVNREQLREEGAAGMLLKPFSNQHLLEEIERILAEPSRYVRPARVGGTLSRP